MDYFSFDLQLFADVALTLEGATVSAGKFTAAPTGSGDFVYAVSEGKITVKKDDTLIGTFSVMETKDGVTYVSFKAENALASELSTDGTVSVADNTGTTICLREADYSALTSGIKIDVSGNTKFFHLKDTPQKDTINFAENGNFGWWESQGGGDTYTFGGTAGQTMNFSGGGRMNSTENLIINFQSKDITSGALVFPFTGVTFSNNNQAVLDGANFQDKTGEGEKKIPKVGVIALAGNGTITNGVTFDNTLVISKAPTTDGSTWKTSNAELVDNTDFTFAEALSYIGGDYWQDASKRAEYVTPNDKVTLTADIKGTNTDGDVAATKDNTLILNDVTVNGAIDMGKSSSGDSLQLSGTSAATSVAFSGTLNIAAYTTTATNKISDGKIDTMPVPSTAATYTLTAPINGSDDNNTLVIGSSGKMITIDGAVNLGAGNDTFSFASGSKLVQITGGITGGAGNNSYDFTNASAADTTDEKNPIAATSVVINDFKSTDTLTVASGVTAKTTSTGGVSVTAQGGMFTLGAAAGITMAANGQTITVSDAALGTEFVAGAISGLDSSLVFTAGGASYVLTADKLTVLKTTGSTVYTVTDKTALSFASATGTLTSTEGAIAGEAQTAEELTLKLNTDNITLTSGESDTNYYSVTYVTASGKYKIATTSSDAAPTTADEGEKLVGYFAATVTKNVDQPSVKIAYHEGAGASAPVSSFIGGITVDASGMNSFTITGGGLTADLKGIDVTGISDGTVKIEKLSQTVTTVDGTEAANVTYLPTYTLSTASGADTITLVKGGNADATTYYTIAATTGGTTAKPTVTYSIAKYTGTGAPAAGTAYFSVAYTKEGTGYAVAFSANKDTNQKTTVENLTADCWDNVKVDATALGHAGTITFDNTTDEGTYAVTAPYGVVYAPTSDNTITRAGSKIVSLDPSTSEGVVQKIELKDTANDGTTYYVVGFAENPANSGIQKITLTKKTTLDENNDKTYFTVKNTNSGKYTIAYTNTDADKKLSGLYYLDDTTEKAFQIAVDGTSATVKSLDISDGIDGAVTNVDYNVTAIPAGIDVSGNRDGKDTITYATDYNADVTLKLSSTAMPATVEDETKEASTYYQVTVTAAGADDKGVAKVTASAVSGTPDATALANNNYFIVTATNANGVKSYSVTYHKATADTKGADLKTATGKINVDVSGIAEGSLASINLNLNEATGASSYSGVQVNSKIYQVINLDEKAVPTTTETAIQTVTLAASSTTNPVPADQKTYVDYYALGSTTTISLASVAENAPRYYVATVDTASGSGIHKFNIAAGTTSKPTGKESYFVATLKNGKITLEFVEGTAEATTDGSGTHAVMTLADITKLIAADSTAQFTVNASGLADTVTSIALTADADGKINYSVTNVPKTVTSIENTGTGDDVAYQQTYVLDESAKTITLGATESIVCYKVTSTGGTAALLGVNTVKIEASGVTIAKNATDDEIAAAMAKAKITDYFTVKTDSTGNVTVAYTEAAENGIPLSGSGIQVAVDASAAEQTADVNFSLSATGNTVYQYAVSGLTKNQTVDNGTKGAKATTTPTVDYEASYKLNLSSLSGKISLDTTAAGNAKYYVVTIDSTYDGTTSSATAKGITQYNITAGNSGNQVSADAEISAKHYIKVTYQSDYVIAISYVNADGDAKYNLSADAIGRITVDASGAASTVDTINVDATDTANYELLHVKSGVTVNCDTAKDVVAYDTSAVLTGSLTLKDADASEVYYQVVPGTTTSGVTACTLGAQLTTKPADTVNYIKVTRASGGYTVDYVPASSGTALKLDNAKSTLTVAASDATGNTVAPAATAGGKTVTNAAGIVVNVTGMAGGWTIANQANAVSGNLGTSTIAYATEFAWSTGVYYIPVETATTDSTFKTGVTAIASGATAADQAKKYVVVTVTKDSTTGKYTITTTGRTASPGNTTGTVGIMTENSGESYSGKITVQAPDSTANWKFDATNTNAAFSAITNVQNGAVITNIDDDGTTVTTAALAKGNSFTVNNAATEGTAKTFTAAEAGAIALKYVSSGTKFQVESGVLLLDEAMAAAQESTVTNYSVQVMSLGASDDGVVVTFDKTGGVTSITGLTGDEMVKVNEGGTTYQYVVDGDYITKTNTSTSAKTKAAKSTGNILALGYSDGNPAKVGKFTWNSNAGADPYYLAIGTTKTTDVALTVNNIDDSQRTNAVSGTYYLKAVVDGTTLRLTPVLANSLQMVDEVTDYTGTITIAAPQIAFTYTKPSTATYSLAVTGAMTGSTFKDLGAADTVESVAGASTQITMKVTDGASEKTYTYTTADATKKMEFVGSALKNGAVTVGTSEILLSDGSKVIAGTAVKIVVTNGEITSLKELDPNETFTVTTDTTITTYTADNVDGKTVTKSVKTIATGETKDVVYSLENAGDEVINATEKSYAVTSNFAWGTKNTTGYFKITSGVPATITNKNSTATPSAYTDTLSTSDEGYIRAEITDYDATTQVNTLKLTPMVVAADGKSLVEDTRGNFSGYATIDATAAVVSYDGSSKGTAYKVNFVNAGDGSTFTLARNDRAASTSFTSATAKITVNGTTFTSGTSSANTIATYYDGQARIISGTIAVKETTYSTAYNSTTHLASGSATLTVTADETITTPAKPDGAVVVTYGGTNLGGVNGMDGGQVTALTGLTRGESVTIAGTTTVTYEATTNDTAGTTIWRTTTTSDGTATTYVKHMASAGTDVVSGGSVDTLPAIGSAFTDGTYYKTTTASQAFAWTGTSKGGYVLVDAKGNATLANGSTSIGYQNGGATYLKAAITDAGVLTLTDGTVDMAGRVGDGDTVDSGAIKLTLTLPTAGQKISYAKDAGVASLTVTGAAADSSFTNLGALANISVTTSSLKAGDSITLNTGTAAGTAVAFTAGAAGALVIQEGKAYSGTFQVTTPALEAYVLDSDKNETETRVTYTAGSAGDVPTGTTAQTDGAIVALSGGKISSVKGLGNGETVVTVVQTVEKDGTVTRTRTTYEAKEITDAGANKGKLTVTKKVEVGHTKGSDTYVETTTYTQVFAKDTTTKATGDVTVTTGWTASDVTTTGTFDWKNTGYWLAEQDTTGTAATNPDYGKYFVGEYDGNTPPARLPIANAHAHNITAGTDKSVYIAVTSEKTLAGDYKVAAVKLVQKQASGELTDFTGEIGTIEITAPNDGGLTLPADHDGVFTITTTAQDKTFTLGAKDTLNATLSADGKAIGLVVGTETKTFTSAAGASQNVVLKGDGTVTKGTFLIDSTATGSKTPKYDADTVMKTIAYTPGSANKDGVAVTFASGEIANVKGLNRGESVTITNVKGTAETLYEKTVITKAADSDKVTKTFTRTGWPTDVIMTRDVSASAEASTDVFAFTGYTVTNKFDIDSATEGTLGLFDAGTAAAGPVTVKKQADGDRVTFPSTATDNYYLAIGGSTATVKGVATTTIGYVSLLKYDNTTGRLDRVKGDDTNIGNFTTFTLAAPASGNLVLADGAVEVYKEYTYDSTTGTYVVDETNAATVKERGYGIAVSGAQAGQSFDGFSAKDTVTGSGLDTGAEITVNKTAYAAAAIGTLVISGDGYAQEGKFSADSKHTISLAKVVDENGTAKEGTTTVKWSKGDGARVEISNGAIDEIKQIGAGETIVVTQALKDGATTTTTYVSTSITSGEDKGKILVTKTVDADGAKTEYTMVISSDGEDIWKKGTNTGWTMAGDVTTTSQFDWTAAGNSGYFAVTPTTDSEGALTGIGTVTVDKQTKTTITKKNADAYYLKVTPEKDNTVSTVGLYQVQSDGSMKQVPTATFNGLTGTINITAPTAALTYYNILGAATNVAVNITDAAAKSAITMKAGDTLTTASIAPSATRDTEAVAAASITVNTKSYEAGATGAMKFLAKGSTANDALLSSGVVKMVATDTFYAAGADNKVGSTFDTDNVLVTYTKGTGTTPALVTVKNGVVTNITGLSGTDTVATQAGTGLTYTYGAAGNVTTTGASTAVGNETLAALAKSATITFSDMTLTSGADNNAITFVNEGNTLTVKDGVLVFSGTAIKATGSASDAQDYVQVAGGTTDPATATATNATVTIKDGKVTSITGLLTGENIAITKHEATKDANGATVYVDTVETYSLSGSKLTKSVKVGTADPTTYTAYITSGADILAASYIGGSSTVDEEDGALVGQFSWSDTSNENSKRATGFFEIDSRGNAKPIADQTAEVKLAAKKADTRYLVASVSTNATGAVDGGSAQELTVGALTVYGTGSAKAGQTADATLTASDSVTVTAPTTAITYTKNGDFKLTVNKLAANSVIANITKGDKVTTAALDENAQVRVGGNTYTAAKSSTLIFVGETDGAATPTLTAALLSGKIKIAAGGSAVLSGDTEKNDAGASANDVTVAVAASATDVIVNVQNGTPASITNLTGLGATVTITKTGAATVQYTVLDTASTMIQRTEFTDTNGNGTYDAGTDTLVSQKRKTLAKAGLELDAKAAYMADGKTGYSDTVTIAGQDKNFAASLDWTTGGAKTAYVRNPYTSAIITSKAAADAGVTSNNVTDGTIVLTPDEYVLKVTMNTNANTKVTTVSKVEYLRADATGKLAAVKNMNFYGTVTFDGAASTTPTDATDAMINFTLPTSRTWNVAAQNVAIGSVFKNLASGDAVTSATQAAYSLTRGSFTLYSANANGNTDTLAITYAGDGATVDIIDDGTAPAHHLALGNLLLSSFQSKGEKLTTVETTEAGGEVTTVFEYIEDKTGKYIRKTETAAVGTKSVTQYKITGEEAAGFDILNDATFTNPDPMKNTIVANFDWTMDKNTTGYFAAANGKAAVKAAKTTITSKNTGTYIAVTIDADGQVAAGGIAAVRYDTNSDNALTTQGTMIPAGANAFSGTITIAGPAKQALTLDRTAAITDGTITADATTLAITGAITGSVVNNLVAGDTVTTAALKSANGEFVTLDNVTFRAGANGALTITMQQNAKGAMEHTLTAGTVVLDNRLSANTEGNGFLYVGSGTLVEAANGTSITVQASKNGAAYTIGDIGENEVFKVNGATYRKSDKTLLRETVNAETGNTEYAVYNIGAGKTITSAVLDNAKVWKSTNPAFTDDDPTGNSTHTFTLDLATLDARTKKEIAANKTWKTAQSNAYDFVIDRYLSTDVKSNAALAAATVVNSAAWQVALGRAVHDSGTLTWTGLKTYTADSANIGLTIGQTIKGAKDWNITGGAGADIITGASANSVVNKVQNVTTIDGGAGNDTITGGGATERFVVANGQDVLKSYATGKDMLTMAGGTNFSVKLDGTGLDTNQKTALKGVTLWYDANSDGVVDDGESGVLLVGMGNGKAVNIGGTNYYFGDGTKTRGAATFTYDSVGGAFYYANAKMTNTLKVTTDKTKATKTTIGDTVTVDLMGTDTLTGASYYHNIHAVDASASGNRVYLAASDNGSTLKGGTYQSTLAGGAGNDVLQGGSGADVFWFKDGLDGSDTIKAYTAKNDAVYLGDWDGTTADAKEANGFTVEASGTNVILKNASGLGQLTIEKAASTKPAALNISKDGTSTNTLSYYVGSAASNAKNAYAATVGADMTKTDNTLKAANGATDLNVYEYGSYYIGSTNTAADTMTLKAVDAKNKATTVQGAFSLQSAGHLSSIDVLDASGLKAGSTVALVGAATGNSTLRGSKSNQTNERFYIHSDGTTVVENLTKGASIDDVIELVGTSFADTGTNTTYNKVKGVSFKLDNGGSLFVSGVTKDQLQSVAIGANTIKRTK